MKTTTAKKGTIEEMQELAAANGGKCLSTEYVDSKSKLIWQSAEGREWMATPDSVRQGKWCPQNAVIRVR